MTNGSIYAQLHQKCLVTPGKIRYWATCQVGTSILPKILSSNGSDPVSAMKEVVSVNPKKKLNTYM